MDFTEKQKQELEALVGNVCRWLRENGHPHMTVIVEQYRFVVKEDVFSTCFLTEG